jgi:S-formylglutathione hydrolase
MTIENKEQHTAFGGVQGVYTHQSSSVSGEMEFSVFVPPQAKDAKVPVLYYLSGLTCTQDNVTTKSGFQRIAAELGLIIVCPDSSPRGTGYAGEDDDYDFGVGAGFYVDALREPWAATYRMYSYVVDELPELIAEHFPIDPARAGIFGHSMGGHGALTIGLKNPQTFRSISAFAPIVAPTQVPWGEKAFAGYLGDDREVWKKHDAVELINSGHKSDAEILIDQGTSDPFLESQLQPELFDKACASASQPVTIRMQKGYDHSYYFIGSFMEDHIRHHANILQTDV